MWLPGAVPAARARRCRLRLRPDGDRVEFRPAETKSFAFPWRTDSLPGGAYVAFAAFTAVEASGESTHATQQLVGDPHLQDEPA